MEKIMLIKILKSKQYNKLILTYAKINDNNNDSFKGMAEFTQWIDDTELFNKFDKNDFGKVIDGNTAYSQPDFQGKCKIILTDIIVNGKNIKLN